ncbi:hypothetical protein GWK47_003227 [Chionoecetes opilio]|uniref:Uncharacterized protein n=1 Tax=Chionoecetes opilio TaxID=41210 RepID=A0A8J8WDX8_CHIOP|nr:hypothetical protein GWK47_003227 [Chionoecetes opilio]
MVAVSVVASGIAAFVLGALVSGRWKAGEGGGARGNTNTSTLFYMWGILLETPPDPPATPICVKSSLATYFTVGIKEPPLDSFVDLMGRRGWRWGNSGLPGVLRFYFSSSVDPTTQTVFAQMEEHTLDESMGLVLGGRYAFITTEFQNAYQVASRYTDRSGYTPVYTGTTRYPKFAGTSWGFRIGVPCHRPITTMTQRLIEGGLITSWLGDVVATRVREERQEGIHDQALAKLLTLPLESEEAAKVVVGMVHLQAAFYILAAGLALSCLAFSGELLLVSYCSNIPRFKDHP